MANPHVASFRYARSVAAVLAVWMAVPLPAQQWRPLPDLTPRFYHAMAYDPGRERTVLFGGVMRESEFGDTWEWDGARWNTRRTPTAPAARRAHGMAYDPVRKTVILFGGVDSKKLYGDTWEWDGQRWRQLNPPTSPSPRQWVSMATDPVRGRIWLFGGYLSWGLIGSLSQEIWEWDGTTWRLHTPATSPFARSGAPMAFHPQSGEMVLFGFPGSSANDTWLWNGTRWRQAFPGRSPPGGTTYGMATDPTNGKVMMRAEGSRFIPSVTWWWDGTTWLSATGTQPAQRYPAIEQHAAAGQVILFGAEFSGTPSRFDTWAWEGSAWRQVTNPEHPQGRYRAAHDGTRDEVVLVGLPPTLQGALETWTWSEGVYRRHITVGPQPAPRQFPVLVDHPGSGRVLLFGGRPRSSSGLLNDTWTWDGTAWTQVVTPLSPPPTSLYVAAYDGYRDVAILFGGSDSSLWEWDGSVWTKVKAPGGPASPLGGAAVTFDPVRRRLVLFGGRRGGAETNETWEWDGTQWHALNPPARPPVRCRHSLEYVPALGGSVLFGGSGSLPLSDTWLWNGTTWRLLAATTYVPASLPIDTATYDVGRQRVLAYYEFEQNRFYAQDAIEFVVESLSVDPLYPKLGDNIDFNVNLPSAAGAPFVLALALSARPGIPLRIVPGMGVELLPLAPDPLLHFTLRLPILRVLDGQGRAALRLRVPPDPALLWMSFHAAGFTLAPGPTIGAITNGLPMQVVR